MTKWQDKTIDKTIDEPKDLCKQKRPFVSLYNEYGFDYNNEMYSITEENRDFRKKIQHEIIMEELKTQNILGQHITDEADRIIQEVNDHTNIKTDYVIDTLQPKIETVETKVDTVTTKVNENKSLLDKIWTKVDSLRSAVIG